VAEVAEDTGIGEGSVRVALNRVRGGQVTKLDDGRWALLVKDEA
jgi:DNA-binding transcriptional regulator PaaX